MQLKNVQIYYKHTAWIISLAIWFTMGNKMACFGWNRLNSTSSVQSSSNICNTKPRSTMFQIRRWPKHNSKLKFHTLIEKINKVVKFTLSSHAASAGTRFSTTQAVLRQQTNMREGFTNDPTTHHYGVLHDPATHHTRRVILHDSNYWATKEFSTQG